MNNNALNVEIWDDKFVDTAYQHKNTNMACNVAINDSKNQETIKKEND